MTARTSARFAVSAPLLRLVVALAAAAPAASMFGISATETLTLGTRVEALALWAVCLVPAWRYLVVDPAGRRPYPFFPTFSAVFGAYFALPIALGLTDLGGFGSYLRLEDYARAVDVAVLGWTGVLAGRAIFNRYGHLSARPSSRELGVGDPAPAVLMKWATGFAVLGAVLAVLGDAVLLPTVIRSTVALVQLLGRFGLVLGVMLVVRGQSRPRDLAILATSGAAMALMSLISGSLSGLPFLAAAVGFAIWASRGRFHLREGLAAVALLVVLVGVKAVLPDFRSEVWYGSQRLAPMERIALIESLVQERLTTAGKGGLFAEGTGRFSERSAAADVLADVIQRTPSEVPYWGGESYVSLVGALVPRVLWPDKPEKDLGQRFGHRYGYLAADDIGTSINLPWLAEMYANFGMGFVPVGGLVLGLILGVLERRFNRTGQSVLTTASGIALLVPLYNVESDFSLIYGGLILYGTALTLIVRYIGRPSWSPRRSTASGYLPSYRTERVGG